MSLALRSCGAATARTFCDSTLLNGDLWKVAVILASKPVSLFLLSCRSCCWLPDGPAAPATASTDATRAHIRPAKGFCSSVTSPSCLEMLSTFAELRDSVAKYCS